MGTGGQELGVAGMGGVDWGGDSNSKNTHAIMSSVIRCELSIRPRSARRESAAEDLYALCGVVSVPKAHCRKRFNALDVIPHAAEKVRLIQSCLDVALPPQRLTPEDVVEQGGEPRTFVRRSSRA